LRAVRHIFFSRKNMVNATVITNRWMDMHTSPHSDWRAATNWRSDANIFWELKNKYKTGI
jgi:hypothetical protein